MLIEDYYLDISIFSMTKTVSKIPTSSIQKDSPSFGIKIKIENKTIFDSAKKGLRCNDIFIENELYRKISCVL